ncbi:MAG: hypothetical protein P8Z75_09080 [Gammaproteobacteria bacterium]|jgi:hypothetical protein
MHLEARQSDGNPAESKQEKSPVWLYVTIGILFIPLAVAIYMAMSDSKTGIIARVDRNCNLQQGPCQAVFPNGDKVTLSISPRPIEERKQLHITVHTQGINAKSVYVDFRGQNMYMGYNRPKLKSVGPGQFAGTWVLASCGLFVEHMEWQTVVLIQTAKQRMSAPFPLVTQPITGGSTQ